MQKYTSGENSFNGEAINSYLRKQSQPSKNFPNGLKHFWTVAKLFT